MAQGILPFKYELERSEVGMTALAGLPLYLNLAKVVGLSESIQRHLRVRDKGQGWTDQHGLGEGAVDCLAAGALWEE